MPVALFETRTGKTYRLPKPKGPQGTGSVWGLTLPPECVSLSRPD